MKIFITGADGNVGGRLLQELNRRGHETTGTTINDLDITDFAALSDHISRLSPDLVVHCAALTNVDLCADQPDLALRINGYGTQNVALACQRVGAAICYISTNEVFDGQQPTPYREYDVPHPINPYGYSKWVGEQMVRDLLPQHFIVRISWLFAHGGTNFLQKIVAAAQAGRPLSVVTNEVASPTYAEDFVETLPLLLETGRFGIYHLTNEGRTSRYDFARYILDCYGMADYPITRIVGAQHPRPSRPPVYAALDNFLAAQMGIRMRPWREAVAAFVERQQSTSPTLNHA